MTKCQDDRAKTLEMHGEYLYRDKIFLYRTKTMSEWTVEQIDEALDAYEARNQTTLKESELDSRKLTNIKSEYFGDESAFAIGDFSEYINSPWRKIRRLASIASGCKLFSKVYGSENNTTVSGITILQSEEISDTTYQCSVVVADHLDGNYTVNINLKFQWTSASPAVRMFDLVPNDFTFKEHWIEMPMTAGQDLDFVQEQFIPATIRFQRGKLTLALASDAKTPFEAGYYAQFYRPKGTFFIKSVSLKT